MTYYVLITYKYKNNLTEGHMRFKPMSYNLTGGHMTIQHSGSPVVPISVRLDDMYSTECMYQQGNTCLTTEAFPNNMGRKQHLK